MDEAPITVTCGLVSALLHKELFICPGIRQPCIEVDGKFVTPKDFTYIGNKHSLKDWKNAIRVNGISLRKMMETGELDFYNHPDLCTGRCVSRTLHSIPASLSTSSFESSADLSSLDTATLTEHAYTVLRQVQGEEIAAAATNVTLPQSLLKNNKSKTKSILPKGIVIKKEPGLEDEDTGESVNGGFDLDSFIAENAVGTPSFVLNPACSLAKGISGRSKYNVVNGDSDFQKLAESFPDIDKLDGDCQEFWQGIVNVGLMDTVMKEIRQALDQMKNKIIRDNVLEPDAKRMSAAIAHLGLTDTLKMRLAEHKTSVLRQDIKLQMEIEDLKRKLDESEKKKRENKRKSDAFDSLIELKSKKHIKNEADTSTSVSETPAKSKASPSKKIKGNEDGDYDPNKDSDEGSD